MENCREYCCLNIIVNVSSFSSLSNNVNTTLKYYRKPALNNKIKIDERGHKGCYEKVTGP